MGIIYTAVDLVLAFIEYAILARVIISWIPVPQDNKFIRLLYQITEPILGPIRSIMERAMRGRSMMLDFSPIIAFLLIGVIRNIVGRLLLGGYYLPF